jgi:hypothetical protein
MQMAKQKIIISMIAVVLAFFVFGSIASKGHRKFYAPFYDKLDTIFKGSANYDVLLMGNSKVQFGMHPGVIDSVGKCNSYNIGYAAAGFCTMRMLLQGYLQHHPAPKTIVLCAQESMFYSSNDFSNQTLFYHYLSHREVQEYCKKMNLPYLLPKALPNTNFLYMDDYNRGNIITGWLNKSSFVNDHMYSYKGYTVDKSSTAGSMFNPFPAFKNTAIDSFANAEFAAIVALAQSNNIKLILIWPPNANKKNTTEIAKQNPILFTMLNRICTKNNYPLIRYDTSSIIPQSMFIDDGHLNYAGSLMYSGLVGKLVDSL